MYRNFPAFHRIRNEGIRDALRHGLRIKERYNIAVTQTGLDKAIAFANELFLALEARDHRVVIAPNSERFHRAKVDERENPGKGHHHHDLWSPMRCTVVYIGTVAIGLTVIEMSEEAEARYVNGEYVRLTDYVPKRRGRYAQDHGWTSTRDFPTGRLCLQAYSPYPRADWSHQWRETPGRNLSGRIAAIVRDLEKATVEIANLVEEGEREAEIERQRREAQYERWRREEEERWAVKAVKDKLRRNCSRSSIPGRLRSDSKSSLSTPNAGRRIYPMTTGSAQ